MPYDAMQRRPHPDTAEWRRLQCSFCGKDADHVRFLAAGVAGGTICDGCSLTSLGVFLKAHITSALGMARPGR